MGPVQEYETPAVADVAFRASVESLHSGPLLVTEGCAGVGLISTSTEPGGEVQPATVTVTKYFPLCAVVVLFRVGFCSVELNPPGPVQE